MYSERLEHKEWPDELRSLGILPPDELLELYQLLPVDQQEQVLGRASALRYGPTGMSDNEATLAAIQERYTADLSPQ
jgi:hypothetical protein